MHCLEKYRSKLVRDANRQLRIIAGSPDESAIHDFRVSIKRLTAFYGFLHQVDENLSARRLLKPYRALFKPLGSIRDAQIAIRLVEELDALPNAQAKALVADLRTCIRRDYRRYRNLAGNGRPVSISLPTIRATGITPAAISKQRPVHLDGLLAQILHIEKGMTAGEWHRKRILLKRYRHILDAFSLCPGQAVDQSRLRQISMLEQLLGDWHDRVVGAELIHSLPGMSAYRESLIRQLRSQHRMLLGSARLYLARFARFQGEVGSTR